MVNNDGASQKDESQLSLSRLWYGMCAHKYIMLLVMVLSLLCGYFIATTRQVQYKTNVLLQVTGSSGGIAAASGLAALASDLPFLSHSSLPTKTEAALIRSRYVLAPVVRQLNLNISVSPKRFPVFSRLMAARFKQSGAVGVAPALWGLKSDGFGGEHLTLSKFHVPLADVESPFELVAGRQGSYRLFQHKTLILRGRVGQLVQSRVRPGVLIKVDRLLARPGEHFTVIEHSVDAVAARLAKKLDINQPAKGSNILKLSLRNFSPTYVESTLDAIAQTAYVLGMHRQAQQATKTLRFLNRQLPIVKASLDKAEGVLSTYEARHGNLDMKTAYRLLLQQILISQQQLEALKLKRTELLQRYTEQHPFVVTLNDKVAEVKAHIAMMKAHMRKLPEADKGELQFLRDVKTKNQLYLVLLNRQQEMRVLQAGVVSNIRILSEAATPPEVLFPHRSRIMVAAFFVGLFINLFWVVLLLMGRGLFLTPEKLELLFDLPVLSVLPYSQSQRHLMRYQRSRNNKKYKDYVLARHFSHDMTIESLRSLRTSLALQVKKGAVICIAGLAPGVGKSFISLNLAQVMADTGKRVLLIDVDLRRGHIAKFLNVSGTLGLSNYLQGEASVEDICQKTQSPHLDFISSGRVKANAADLLQGKKLRSLMSKLKKEYDYIVLDTAPVLSVTDSVLTAALSDITLLALCAGRHTEKEMRRGMDIMTRANVNVVGAVFNFQDKKVAMVDRYDAYGYYGYEYKNKDEKS